MSEMKKTGKLINKIRGRTEAAAAGYLERGWVIANHKLVSFHAAFISSILSLPAKELSDVVAAGGSVKSGVLQFMFAPWNFEALHLLDYIISLVALQHRDSRDGTLPDSREADSFK